MTEVFSGFTPVPDQLLVGQDRVDPISALVYGRIFRYSQGSAGVCYASMETIGEELGLSRMTIYRHIKVLIEKGYITDTTPDLVGASHNYIPSAKIRMKFEVRMEEGVYQSDTGVYQNDTGGVSNSYTKIQDKKQEKNITRSAKPKANPIPEEVARPMVDAICEVTHRQYNLEHSRIRASANKLITAGFTSQEVITHFAPEGTWFTHDWRGKQGDIPTPEQVVSEISVLKAKAIPRVKPERVVYR